MSKIFEALQKTEGNLASTAKTVLGDAIALPMHQEPRESEPRDQAHPLTSERSSDKIRVATIHLPQRFPLLPFDGSNARAEEQYRIIRTRISHAPAQPQMLLISSAMAGDGKTISALNIAAALSMQEDVRVLIADCDFRRSTLTKVLGLEPAPGLKEVLLGAVSIEEALVRMEQFPNLYFLAPGATTQNPAELLSTARWQAVQKTLCSEFRFMVIDAAPVGAVAEYELLQLACDGVLLVARQDYTDRQLLKKALDVVPPSKQLGVILNCVEDWFPWKTHSQYYYSGKS